MDCYFLYVAFTRLLQKSRYTIKNETTLVLWRQESGVNKSASRRVFVPLFDTR